MVHHADDGLAAGLSVGYLLHDPGAGGVVDFSRGDGIGRCVLVVQTGINGDQAQIACAGQVSNVAQGIAVAGKGLVVAVLGVNGREFNRRYRGYLSFGRAAELYGIGIVDVVVAADDIGLDAVVFQAFDCVGEFLVSGAFPVLGQVAGDKDERWFFGNEQIDGRFQNGWTVGQQLAVAGDIGFIRRSIGAERGVIVVWIAHDTEGIDGGRRWRGRVVTAAAAASVKEGECQQHGQQGCKTFHDGSL